MRYRAAFPTLLEGLQALVRQVLGGVAVAAYAADALPQQRTPRFVDGRTRAGVVMWLTYAFGATQRKTFELSELLGTRR